jgi:signal transduction histidine kinase/ABC-type nitrate/sulfonate/bicarbonate transport system substrate-binding protein
LSLRLHPGKRPAVPIFTKGTSLTLRSWAGLAAVLLVAPAGFAADAPDHVVLQLKWRHQFQFAGYYAALAQGYYRDAGLDVALQEAVPDRDPAQAVLSGQADFGVGTSDLVLLRDKGQPVVVLAAIFQHSPLVLLADRRAGVDDLHDLYNKPIMIEPLSAELFAYFRDEGIDPAKLHILPHTFDVRDLIDRKVAAMSGYSTDEVYQLKAAGLDFMTFTPRSGGIDFYGDNLFTTESEIRRHPARVRKFLAASLKGWDYALAHQAEIVDLILRDYSRRKSRAQLLFEAEATAQLMHPGLIETGHMNPGRWQHIAEVYGDFGMASRKFSLVGFLYDPNPRPDLRWAYWSLGGLGAVAVLALGWALPLLRFNRQLRHEVVQRRKTEEELRRARDAAEVAYQAKGRYLAVMTHEVRTLLGGIGGLVELLRETALDAQQTENVNLIGQSSESLLKLTSDVLDYSKIESGKLVLEQVPVSLPYFIRTTCDLFRAAARTKGLTLEHVVRAGVPAIVLTDPTRLRQILANLLSNAVKFTAAGSIELSVEPEPGSVAAPGSSLRVRFQVRDSGIGISPDGISRLFEAYSQSDASIARRFGGTGLGLAIAHRLAEIFGGSITVKSVPGKGTTFTVTVVVVVSQPA